MAVGIGQKLPPLERKRERERERERQRETERETEREREKGRVRDREIEIQRDQGQYPEEPVSSMLKSQELILSASFQPKLSLGLKRLLL